jgi:outer membrane protein OmpA-like peptidoglycan-associated protein
MEVVVTDMKKNPRQGEKIIFDDVNSNNTYNGISGKDGTFEIELPGATTYQVRIQALNDSKNYQSLKIPKIKENQEYNTGRFTIRYRPAKVFVLDHVYFDVDKASLREKSFRELNTLADYLKRRSDIRVEIAGHTDSQGDDEHNRKLSQRRARQVKKYLVNQGIQPDRLETKGYGESRPVASNDTREGRQKNRRTEIHILEQNE